MFESLLCFEAHSMAIKARKSSLSNHKSSKEKTSLLPR